MFRKLATSAPRSEKLEQLTSELGFKQMSTLPTENVGLFYLVCLCRGDIGG